MSATPIAPAPILPPEAEALFVPRPGMPWTFFSARGPYRSPGRKDWIRLQLPSEDDVRAHVRGCQELRLAESACAETHAPDGVEYWYLSVDYKAGGAHSRGYDTPTAARNALIRALKDHIREVRIGRYCREFPVTAEDEVMSRRLGAFHAYGPEPVIPTATPASLLPSETR